MKKAKGHDADGLAGQPVGRGAAKFDRWPLAIVAGGLAPLLFPRLPDPAALVLLVLLGVAASCWRHTRPLGIGLIVLSWVLAQYADRLADRLAAGHAGAVTSVTGTVSSLPAHFPELLRFRFEPDRESTVPALPQALRVSWYHEAGAAPRVEPGQRWRLELRLQPPWGAVNFHGPDPERWLFANGIGALGTVRSAERLPGDDGQAASAQAVRASVARTIEQHLPPGAGQGVVRALAIADRSGLDASTRQLLTDTGTAHLLAISGLHVGLAAAAGFWLLRFLLAPARALRRGRLPLFAAAMGGLSAALGYAFLADLGVSTLRAVAMVAVVMAAIVSRRSIHPATALLRAAAVVLLIDPFAPLGAGFWFSFGAVAALLVVFAPRITARRIGGRAVLAQAAVTLTLLPVSAAWFGMASAVALPANLIAIPWVSFLVVPAVLAGIVALPVSEALAAGFWRLGGGAAELLLEVLATIAGLGPEPLALNPLGLARLALAVAGAAALLLPAAMRWKWLAGFLLLPLLLPLRFVSSDRVMVFEVLDSGQGTAAVLHTRSGTLIYDAGPGDGASRNRVRGVILPALGTATPERIVISHGDLDHAGGLRSLAERFPAAALSVNDADSARPRCIAGWTWSWRATTFRALHPSPGLPYLGNDSSCVLSVAGPAGRILLAGDISKPIERRLLAEGLGPHAALLVPHHGSDSSSGAEFLERVRPRLAIATAALGNRFGFPRTVVRARYRAAGVPLLTTGECGAIRVELRDGEIGRIVSARRVRAHIWRWPAAADCP